MKKAILFLRVIVVVMFLVGCPGIFQNRLVLSIPDQYIEWDRVLLIDLLQYVTADHREDLHFEVTDGVGEVVDEHYFRFLHKDWPVPAEDRKTTIIVTGRRGNTSESTSRILLV